jgi:hypothetical protein
MRGLLVTVLSLALAGCGCSETGLAGRADVSTDPVVETTDADAPVDPATDPLDDPGRPWASLEGPPVVLGAGHYPSVVRTWSGWTVYWTRHERAGTLTTLDDEALRTGPDVDVFPAMGYGSTFDWGAGLYGIASRTTDGGALITRDEEGAIHGPSTFTGDRLQELDVNHCGFLRCWVVSYASTGETGTPIRYEDAHVVLLSEPGDILEGPVRLSTTPLSVPRIETGVSGLASVVWPQMDGVWLGNFSLPGFEHDSEAVNVHATGLPLETRLETGALDETLYVVLMDGSQVLVLVVDPYHGELVAEPSVIGRSSNVGHRPGVAAAPAGDMLGVAFQTGGVADGDEGLDLVLVSDRGAPLAPALTILSDMASVRDCDMAWSGSEFLVVYWSQEYDGGPSTVSAQRVRPVP